MSEIDGWESRAIGELLRSVNAKSKQLPSSLYQSGGTYPVVDQSAKYICGYFDDSQLLIKEELPCTVFGDHTRHTKYIDFPFVAGADGTQILKPIDGMEDKLFYYIVSSAAAKIANYGYDRHFKHLKEFPTQYPKAKKEQIQIAKILSQLDQIIEQTEVIIAKQQRIKTGLMKDLLTRGIDENGNIRSEATHEFKDSPVGRIPVEWSMCCLNDCVANNAPICYGILMPGNGYDNGVPVIKVKDIRGGEILQKSLLLTDPKIDGEYKRSKLKADDLLLTIRGTTGRVAIVPEELSGANITQDTARIRLAGKMSTRFFYFLLQGFNLQDQIQLHTLGQAVKGINIRDVKQLFFGLPDDDEQTRIASVLSEFQQQIKHSEAELLKAGAFKAGLMQDLLTGKVRVTDLIPDTITETMSH